jgi:hypothetical protein
LAKLQAFRAEHGHCNVPKTWEDASLATWINHLRSKKSGLSKELIRSLDEIGFDWAPYETEWKEAFAKLNSYKEKNGHCNVTRAEDLRLGNFVANIRSREAQLSEDKIRSLDELGLIGTHSRLHGQHLLQT